jgi:branched-chain amino acid transport system ATP-binding protein
MATAALNIKELSKTFGGLQVLMGLSLDVKAGERVAVIGPNGAGKTTLFNIISGELSATAGRVYVFGHDITNVPTHHRIHLGLGRSFQINHLFFNLTVMRNVLLALNGIRRSRYHMFRPIATCDEILVEAQDLLKSLSLWENRNDLVRSISYGDQRKMEIALSMASEPKLLLLDEPSAGLDMAEVPSFINTMKALATGTTLLFSAHDMDVVFDLADRVVVLYYGQIVAQGTCEEIQADPKVREIYLGVEEGP